MVCKIGLRVAKNENFAAANFLRHFNHLIAFAVPFTPTYKMTRMNYVLQRVFKSLQKLLPTTHRIKNAKKPTKCSALMKSTDYIMNHKLLCLHCSYCIVSQLIKPSPFTSFVWWFCFCRFVIMPGSMEIVTYYFFSSIKNTLTLAFIFLFIFIYRIRTRPLLLPQILIEKGA